MPNIKSAEKRVMVIARNNLRNRIVKSNIRNVSKKFTASVAGNDAQSEALFKQAVSTVDKAVTKGVIHKNKANRKKAQLARAMNIK